MGSDIRKESEKLTSTVMLQLDGSLIEPVGTRPRSPQYHGERTKSAASPRVHPRWRSARQPVPPETLASPKSSRMATPRRRQSPRTRASPRIAAAAAEQPPGNALALEESEVFSEAELDGGIEQVLGAARMVVVMPEGATGLDGPAGGSLPYLHAGWSPVARPPTTPPTRQRDLPRSLREKDSGERGSARLWRPVAGTERQSMSPRVSPRGVSGLSSPRHAMRVTPMEIRPTVPRTPASGSVLLGITGTAPAPAAPAPPAAVKPAVRPRPAQLSPEMSLPMSLKIGRFVVGPDPETQLRPAAVSAQQPRAVADLSVDLSASVASDGGTRYGAPLLPSLTQGPRADRPDTMVKLWL